MLKISRNSQVIWAGLLTSFTLVGCGGTSDNKKLISQGQPSQLPEVAQRESRIIGRDAQFLKMETELPGFAGYVIDPNGYFKVLITDDKDSNFLRTRIHKYLVQLYANKKEYSLKRKLHFGFSSFQFKTVEYDLKSLMNYRELISFGLVDRGEVGGVGYNETTGLVTVGLNSMQDVSAIKNRLKEMKVPLNAVEFIQNPRAKVAATLSDVAPRPTPTGFEFQTYGVGGEFCTMGFNAQIQGTFGFFSAGHCGTGYNSDQASIGRSAYQPTTGTYPAIARLTLNPPNVICDNPSGCRSSDAAFYQYNDQTNQSNFTRIAKTASIGYGGYQGSTEVVGYFNVIGRRDYPDMYDSVEKVGYVTGWTGGQVVLTCYDGTSQDDPTTPNIEDTSTKVCSDYYTGVASSGDSGSPVFERFNDTDINILGITWGGVTYENGTTGGAMSSISNMDSDFGYIDVLPFQN